jgi:hypothetical protein
MAITTQTIGEEEPFVPTTQALGEEDSSELAMAPSTMATGEEEPQPTTMATGEEDAPKSFDGGVVDPFGAY